MFWGFFVLQNPTNMTQSESLVIKTYKVNSFLFLRQITYILLHLTLILKNSSVKLWIILHTKITTEADFSLDGKKMVREEEAEGKWTWAVLLLLLLLVLLLEPRLQLQICPAAPSDICPSSFGKKSRRPLETQTASIEMQQLTQPHCIHVYHQIHCSRRALAFRTSFPSFQTKLWFI